MRRQGLLAAGTRPAIVDDDSWRAYDHERQRVVEGEAPTPPDKTPTRHNMTDWPLLAETAIHLWIIRDSRLFWTTCYFCSGINQHCVELISRNSYQPQLHRGTWKRDLSEGILRNFWLVLIILGTCIICTRLYYIQKWQLYKANMCRSHEGVVTCLTAVVATSLVILLSDVTSASSPHEDTYYPGGKNILSLAIPAVLA